MSQNLRADLVKILNRIPDKPLVKEDITLPLIFELIRTKPVSNETFQMMQGLFDINYPDAELEALQEALLGRDQSKEGSVKTMYIKIVNEFVASMRASFLARMFRNTNKHTVQCQFIILNQYRLSESTVASITDATFENMDRFVKSSKESDVIRTSMMTELGLLRKRRDDLVSSRPPVPARPSSAKPVAADQDMSTPPVVVRPEGDNVVVSIREKAFMYPLVKPTRANLPEKCDSIGIDGELLTPGCLLYHFSEGMFFVEEGNKCSSLVADYLKDVSGNQKVKKFQFAVLVNKMTQKPEQTKYEGFYLKLYTYCMCCLDMFLTLVEENPGSKDYLALANNLQEFFLQADQFMLKYIVRNDLDGSPSDDEISVGNMALITAYMAVAIIAVGKSLSKSSAAFLRKASRVQAGVEQELGKKSAPAQQLSNITDVIMKESARASDLSTRSRIMIREFLNRSHPDFRAYFGERILTQLE